MAFQITVVSIICSTVRSGADQGNHQRSASLAFVRGIHQWPVDSPHKKTVTWKMFPFDDVIMRRSSTHGFHLKSSNELQWLIKDERIFDDGSSEKTQTARFTWPTWGPPGSCRPQVGPMLAHEPCCQGTLIYIALLDCKNSVTFILNPLPGFAISSHYRD